MYALTADGWSDTCAAVVEASPTPAIRAPAESRCVIRETIRVHLAMSLLLSTGDGIAHRNVTGAGPLPPSAWPSRRRIAWHQRVADDAGINRPVRRQRTRRFVRQLQQSPVGGIGEHGMQRRQRRRQSEIRVALLEVRDACGGDAVQNLPDGLGLPPPRRARRTASASVVAAKPRRVSVRAAAAHQGSRRGRACCRWWSVPPTATAPPPAGRRDWRSASRSCPSSLPTSPRARQRSAHRDPSPRRVAAPLLPNPPPSASVRRPGWLPFLCVPCRLDCPPYSWVLTTRFSIL